MQFSDFSRLETEVEMSKQRAAILSVFVTLAAISATFISYRLLQIGGRAAGVPLPRVMDREFGLVNAYLRQNLDDGDFEVVRWWAARPVSTPPNDAENAVAIHEIEKRLPALKDELRQLRLEEKSLLEIERKERQIEDELAAIERIKAASGQHEQMKDKLACRLKYRTKNSSGDKVLADRVFIIDGDGKVGEASEHGEMTLRPLFAD